MMGDFDQYVINGEVAFFQTLLNAALNLKIVFGKALKKSSEQF